MVAAARERLGPDADIRQVDLLELELDEPVDAILSTATFHWIADHERLFARLRAALRPGGRLLAQCGGEGNIDVSRGVATDAVLEREPYTAHFRHWQPPWHYAGPEATRERLLAAGFTSAECWLQPAPQQPEQPREFLATIVLGPHVQKLPAELRDPSWIPCSPIGGARSSSTTYGSISTPSRRRGCAGRADRRLYHVGRADRRLYHVGRADRRLYPVGRVARALRVGRLPFGR